MGFSSQPLKTLLFLFLAFSVLSSKHILIYNEETLIAISFIAFIWTISHYFGNTIQQSFQERRDGIQAEIQNFEKLKRDSLEQCRVQHQLVAGLSTGIENVEFFTNRELVGVTSGEKTAIKKLFSLEITEKWKTISLSDLPIQQELQQLIAASLMDHLLVESPQIKATKQSTLNSEIIQEVGTMVRQKLK